MSELRSRKSEGVTNEETDVAEETKESKSQKKVFTIRTEIDEVYSFLFRLVGFSSLALIIVYGGALWYQGRLGDCGGICKIEPLKDFQSHEFANCQAREVDHLQFNRIPRTGSTVIKTILRELQDYKAFKMISPGKPFRYGIMADGKSESDNSRITKNDLQYIEEYSKQLRKKKEKQKKKAVLEGHFLYEDFITSTNNATNKYTTASITMIREPIERLASAYAMIRKSSQPEEDLQFVKKKLTNKMTLGECILSPSCTTKNRLKQWCSLQTTYLCGIGNGCKQNNDGGYDYESIEIAKRILTENYTFFGMTEDLKKSLAILEVVLPTFFEDSTHTFKIVKQLYKGDPYQKLGSNYGEPYTMPSHPEEYRFLKEACQADLEIYKYAKKLFSERYDICFPNNDNGPLDRKVKEMDVNVKLKEE